ncbi:MAG: VCBS repeat-containing protein [Actinobacteria bacterium]|nr:VCBS repeat-containing protein [Actinomycetota bacterium]NIW29940.1 hypothetical protein [Actinomycetota bacterium]
MTSYGSGAVAGDVDGDGDLDLYVTAFGRNQLFPNDGDGTFTDVTERAGADEPLWSMSAAFADVDRDGDLDLYVTNYVTVPSPRRPSAPAWAIPCGAPRRPSATPTATATSTST